MTLDSRTAGSLLLALASVFTSVEAAPLVFTGNLASDDDVFTTTFHIDAAGPYRIQSWSYAGGTLADGSVVEAGGFDVILSLFDAGGLLLAGDDDGVERVDLASGASYDAAIEIDLAIGAYTLAITQFDSFARGPTLADGFSREGDGNFTPGLIEDGPCTATSFCDVSGSAASARTSFFAVDVTPAPVPLPPALALFATGLAGLAWRAERRSARI